MDDIEREKEIERQMDHLDTFFNAKSIAVIGASSNERKVGYAILKNIIGIIFLD